MVKNKGLPDSARPCKHPHLVILSLSLTDLALSRLVSCVFSLSRQCCSSWGYPLDPAEAGPRQMASLTQWTWVWVNSRSWWWTGRPGVLQSMGSRRVGHDWTTELSWTELNWILPKVHLTSLHILGCPALGEWPHHHGNLSIHPLSDTIFAGIFAESVAYFFHFLSSVFSEQKFFFF